MRAGLGKPPDDELWHADRIINTSRVNTYIRCPQLYFKTYELNLTPTGASKRDLDFALGTAFHRVPDLMHNRHGPIDILSEVVQSFSMAEPDELSTKLAEMWEERIVWLEQTVPLYIEKWTSDDALEQVVDKEVEVWGMTENYTLYLARLDGICIAEGSLWTFETKTAAWDIDRLMESQRITNQNKLYGSILEAISSEDLRETYGLEPMRYKGVYMDYINKAFMPKSRTKDGHSTPAYELSLDKWRNKMFGRRHMTLRHSVRQPVVDAMERAVQRLVDDKHMDKNFNACYDFGSPCMHLADCQAQKNPFIHDWGTREPDYVDEAYARKEKL